MVEIFKKLGNNKGVYKILCESGWNGTYMTLVMQKYRGSLSKEVSLILWEYCQKNGIDVKREDF